jgi:hypothetical protein
MRKSSTISGEKIVLISNAAVSNRMANTSVAKSRQQKGNRHFGAYYQTYGLTENFCNTCGRRINVRGYGSAMTAGRLEALSILDVFAPVRVERVSVQLHLGVPPDGSLREINQPS